MAAISPTAPPTVTRRMIPASAAGSPQTVSAMRKFASAGRPTTEAGAGRPWASRPSSGRPASPTPPGRSRPAGPNLRIAWHMAKKGKIDVRTIWPDQAASLITNIGVSHYDDARGALRGWRPPMVAAHGACALGWRTSKARGRSWRWRNGVLVGMAMTRRHLSNMHKFFREAGSTIAHEAYLNGNGHELDSPTRWPKASARYRDRF